MKTKVLLSKLGLDVHNRGLLTVAQELRDAGMEVIYLGNAMNDKIVAAAMQESADVVGVSSLGGAHLTLGGLLLKEAAQTGILADTVFIIGGVFSPADGRKLKEMGFDLVFPPGTTRQQILDGIAQALAAKAA